MEDIIKRIQEFITLYGFNVIGAILIFILGRWIAKLARKIIERLMTKNKLEVTVVTFVGNFIYVAIYAFAILAALSRLGIQTTSFIAVIGAAGLAVGLALQGSLSNFAAGVLLIIFRPFKVGDFVDAGGATGTVEEIHIFTTQLKTPDNKTLIVPNSKLTADIITNFSKKDMRRVDMVFGVSYSDNIDKVKETIADVLSKDDRILKEPAITIGVIELADSSVNFAVRPWVKTADYWSVFFDTTENMKKRFDAEGISIPFPQRDIHVFEEK